MKTILKLSLVFSLVLAANFSFAGDQIDPAMSEGIRLGDNEDQLDQQVKPHTENSANSNEIVVRKSTTNKSEIKTSSKSVNSLYEVVMNCLPTNYSESSKQSFFFLPFSFNLK